MHGQRELQHLHRRVLGSYTEQSLSQKVKTVYCGAVRETPRQDCEERNGFKIASLLEMNCCVRLLFSPSVHSLLYYLYHLLYSES